MPAAVPTMSVPKKRSITIRGHRTSVSIEDEFWACFREIACADEKSINLLATEIDASRDLSVNLASSIRLYVLSRFMNGTTKEPIHVRKS